MGTVSRSILRMAKAGGAGNGKGFRPIRRWIFYRERAYGFPTAAVSFSPSFGSTPSPKAACNPVSRRCTGVGGSCRKVACNGSPLPVVCPEATVEPACPWPPSRRMARDEAAGQPRVCTGFSTLAPPPPKPRVMVHREAAVQSCLYTVSLPSASDLSVQPATRSSIPAAFEATW
jgi:hypothetical protein